jgi:serine/threonine-protein kinase HipA
MTASLAVLLAGARVGAMERDRKGRLSLRYDEAWVSPRSPRIPLSLSMPLASLDHPHDPVVAFLWNLLPDNDRVLERWAARFQVSARNAFGLISHVGEDCAGAVQFVRPQRLEELVSGREPPVEWLDEHDLESRLRALRADPSQGRAGGDTGQFSLAGAQPKTALLFQQGRWGVPSGRMPTTHILKPATGEFDGHAENEHFCLSLARRLGLPTASSEVRRFGNESAIVVERYDRAVTAALAAASAARAAAFAAEAAAGGSAPRAAANAADAAAGAAALGALAETQPILRLHQEDLCQALAILPTRKYQNEGGPSPAAILGLLRQSSSRPDQDIDTFIQALIFNWIIGGTDAHAKNYSLLHGAGGRVRLAPLYDLASALPYDSLDARRIKVAMAIGGEYRLRDIGPHQWLKLAREVRIDEGWLLDRANALSRGIAAEAPAVRETTRQAGLGHEILDILCDRLVERAAHCQQVLRRAA